MDRVEQPSRCSSKLPSAAALPPRRDGSGVRPAAVTACGWRARSAAGRAASQPHHARGERHRGGRAVSGRRPPRARRSRRDRTGSGRRGHRAAWRIARHRADPVRTPACGADRDRISRPFSRGVGGAHPARSAGRSGGGGTRRRGAHRRAGGKLGGRDPRRCGALDSWSHRRTIWSNTGHRRCRRISAHMPSSRSPALPASSAGCFASEAGEASVAHQAAAGRDDGRGCARCGQGVALASPAC